MVLKGKNTLHPDCSDNSAVPWGFDTFGYGTVGQAILSWLLNVWDDMDGGNDLKAALYDELNWYINAPTFSAQLTDAWLEDYAELLKVYVGAGSRIAIIVYEECVKNWLQKQLNIYLDSIGLS